MNRLELAHFFETFFAELGKAGIRRQGPPGPGFPSGWKTRPPNAVALKPFQNFVSSLKQSVPLSIPLLQDLAILGTKMKAEVNGAGIITRRINRRYYRLCRTQEELGQLDLKKAAPGVSSGLALEDYVFSRIDFTRYREIDRKIFETLFPEGLTDFDGAFLKNTFGLDRREIQSVIEGSYKNINGLYRIQRENPLILSIMRTLETSLESLPLFTDKEIQGELEKLLEYAGAGSMQGTERLYPLLVCSLDNVLITHEDGMTTKLFISPQGDLSGTFLPGNKPWTRVLIRGGE